MLSSRKKQSFMARLKGILKIEGQLDGFSFYNLNGQIIVRKTGGFDGEKIKKNANYVRTRENASEFGNCSRAGKVFRSSLEPYLKLLGNSKIHSMVTQLFTQIKDLDGVSERGKRCVAEGIKTADGKKLVKNFNFSSNLSRNEHLEKINLDLSSGAFSFCFFANKLPSDCVVSVTVLILNFDFETLTYYRSASTVFTFSTESDGAITDGTIQIPTGDGIPFGLLYVERKQIVNEESYRLIENEIFVVGVE